MNNTSKLLATMYHINLVTFMWLQAMQPNETMSMILESHVDNSLELLDEAVKEQETLDELLSNIVLSLEQLDLNNSHRHDYYNNYDLHAKITTIRTLFNQLIATKPTP